MYPDDLLYTEDHEWIRDDGGEYVVGITVYAVDRLGDVTFVELPELGADVGQGENVGTVESMETARDFYSPVSGHVCEINDILEDSPELVNHDPYGDGWFFKLDSVKSAELKKLMSALQYEQFIQKQSEQSV